MRSVRYAACMILVVLACFGLHTRQRTAAQGGLPATTTALVNLRAGAGTHYPSLAQIPPNTAVSAEGRNEATSWLRVNYNGQYGWVAIKYLLIQGNPKSLPIANSVETAAPTAAPSDAGNPNADQPPRPPQNGDILALNKYAESPAVNYYRLTYYSDGLKINGFLSEPKREGRFPAVIYNRGGNRDAGALRGYEFVALSEAGFVVVASQYRGGGGSEGWDNLGGVDVNDVLNLIPLLQARPNVDGGRIAMFGTSRGAMMTYIALRKTSAIKVAATTSGLADLFMWAQERTDLDESVYPDLIGATTKSNPRLFRDRSATYWAGQIRAPLLIMHGDADPVVNVQQSVALYNKMRAAGRKVELSILPGGDHGLFNYAEGMPQALRWFSLYMQAPGENFDYDFNKPAIDTANEILRASVGN